jgi:glycosyltransferase involved in cell wall biosynthesis
MKTIHLVYPHGSRVSCPDAIGRNVASRLSQRYNVKLYDWNDWRAVVPGPNDVLLGHPHPMPWTCFRRSLKHPGWRRIIIMSPYHHGDDLQVAFVDPIMRYADLYLAITGNYWFSSIASSGFAHWLPKMIHLDLAVDRNDFPPIKKRFNPPGQRRFVYIGNCFVGKNVGYLTEIASLLKNETEIDWIGNGRPSMPALKSLGFFDFSTATAKTVITEYDFLLTVGKADANPATVLEAMAWGLIPVCTPQSGYTGYAGIINIPPSDPGQAVSILRDLQYRSDKALNALQTGNWDLLNSRFHWDRFAQQVIDAIESEDSPALGCESWQRKWALRWAAVRSPYSPLRPLNVARFARGIFQEPMRSTKLRFRKT